MRVMAAPTRPEDALADGPLQDEDGEDDLQAEAPDDGAPADGPAVRRKDPCQKEHGEQAKDPGESCQCFSLVKPILCAGGEFEKLIFILRSDDLRDEWRNGSRFIGNFDRLGQEPLGLGEQTLHHR